MLRRRAIIVGCAIAPLGLAACNKPGGSSTTVDTTVGQVATYVDAFAKGLLGAVQQIGQLGVQIVSESALAVASTAIGQIQALAQQVAQAATTAAQQPLIQKIVTYADTVFSNLAPVLKANGATTIADILQSAEVLLPVIMSLVQLVIPAAATARSASITARTSINKDQAFLILKRSAATLR